MKIVPFFLCIITAPALQAAENSYRAPVMESALSLEGAATIREPYPILNGGAFDGPQVKESPDPLVRYRWKDQKTSDGLQIYFLRPVSAVADKADSFEHLASASTTACEITVRAAGSIRFDFGVESAAWLEFDSPDCNGSVEMSISEYNEVPLHRGLVKTKAPVKHGNTYRLELNEELYEGVRFGWIHARSVDKPWRITTVRLVCQAKPANYEGSFSCSDPLLTRIWYTSAYGVRLNLLKDYFGAILMDRGDRQSWTGDAHPSQAAALVAFANRDFIRQNLERTSEDNNGIRSYSLYWVFSLLDYYRYTGDTATLLRFVPNACAKLDEAYAVFGQNPKLRFYGWDERLCAGFEIWFKPSPEAQNAYKMLSIRAWKDFAAVMGQYGRTDLRDKYDNYARDKMAELRKNSSWSADFGLHAAADAINTGSLSNAEKDALFEKHFLDRVNRISLSPFNQYFVIQAVARMGKHDDALSSIRDMWGGMVRYGGTTTFEVYRPSWNAVLEPNAAVPNSPCGIVSLCHPWGAGPVKWLNEEVLGIMPTLPGFKAYDILPHPGRTLTRVSGETPTPLGNIRASFDLSSGLCSVSAPAGTIGRVGIPKVEKTIASIAINGKLAWDGAYHAVAGIGGASQDAEFVYFTSVRPGTYALSVAYSGTTPAYDEPPVRYAAEPVKLDTTTSGDWGGVYGKEGYVLCNYNGEGRDKKSLPSYVTSLDYFRAFPKNGLPDPTVWASGTSDKRALAPDAGNGLPRNATCFSNTDQTMSVTIGINGTREYQVALYFVDWDKKGSRLAVEMFDALTLNLIAPVKVVNGHSGGAYVVCKYDKSVKFRINKVRGDILSLSGIFFDPATPSSMIKDFGMKEYVHLSKDLPHSEANTWRLVCTMPYNCHFQPWIQVESPEGKEIRFDSSNPLVLYLTPTETYTTKSGIQDYEAKNWVSGEGAIYTIPAGVTVKAVKYRETGYNTTFAGSFECNDNDYNILWKKAARTAYICMRDWFYDCPDRERVGFWGDGTPELNQCFYVFDTASHRLCKELVLRKLEPGFYPGQHLEFLGEYGLWFYCLQTGDLESIRAVYEPTKTFLFETYKFGNPQTWFDWGIEITDTAVIETCFHYIDLKTLRKMALVTGHEGDIAAIDAKLDGIKSTFDCKYWKGSYYMSSQVTTPDDRANAMAVNAGLADTSKWDAIYDNVLTKKFNASNFFDRWVFEALCAMGKQEYALLRMYNRYKTMIPCSFTTLWEVYDRWWKKGFEAGSSLNHGWNPPAIILSQSIAGVSPEAPGWSTYHVLPKEAFLTDIRVVVPSIKGNVTVEMKKNASEYSLDLISPPNTKAIVGIPKGSFSTLNAIKVNDVTVWKGAYRGGVTGITWNGEDAGYVKFNVEPGTWRFVGLGTLPITSPKPLPPPPPNDTALDKKSWTASASVADGVFVFNRVPFDVSAANAIDGDHWTGWRDMTKTQYPGQWFQVDMKQEQTFYRIVLDNTWALWDSPDKYSVSVSNDGTNWGDPIATGSGQLGMTTITFPPQTARYIRITQTGTNAIYHWSIYELDVYRKNKSITAADVDKAGSGPGDPNGVLLKPIPEKLVVLTFDDGCASGYAVIAPILKSLGFSGSFYVCDFDSFKTRKDWYLTWRQMQAMAADGFEIGNHTVGHWGGLESFLGMEDQLLANNVPKPTTVCWPVYQVAWSICPDLAANGYTFGRGGHDRPYCPTVDNPFDVPSFTIRDGVPVETFIKQVQQACQGRVVVFTFHGVPDMEHPSVGLEPATFKVMMQYLKDNNYKVIALRDLAKYIDPAKAAKLPPTANDVKRAPPFMSIKDDKPYIAVASDIRTFAFPDLPPVSIAKTNISVTVPYATDVTALAPDITVSADATIAPASGASRDFSKPQTYTVTGKDGSRQTYTVTVNKTAVSTAKDMLTFVLPGPISGVISGTRIGAYVPPATDVKALAPTFTLSPFATAIPPSGTARDFGKPQTYTITAQDGTSQIYTVTVVKSDKPNTFTWKKAEAGNWSDGPRWANNLADGSAPVPAGRPDYILNFNMSGNHAVTHDLQDGFQLNQLNIDEKFGLNLAGKRVALVANSATGNLPQIHVNTSSESNPLSIPMELAADVTVNVKLGGRLFVKGLISGSGSLTLNCPGSTNDYHNWGILRIENKTNTYSGGTIINGGQLFLLYAEQGLGTGPVTLNDGADIRLECNSITNPLIINGGTIEGGTWNAPITLNGNAQFAGTMSLNELSGGMSGPGGFTQIGPIGPFSRVNAGEVYLWGANTYTGPTTVHMGTLIVKKAVSLYNADPASWTAAKISVHPAAALQIAVGGPGEFTGAQVGTLLKNLTVSVNNNGLMAGSVFCVDTAKATGTVTVSSDITDSKGPGGGAFLLKKCGAGTLQLSGNNTYTGQTILEGGTLSVASLNSVAKGKASSSLGAPTNVETGEIVIGKDDGECALLYTGTGETSDRVINLAGKNSTVTFDQSGSGLLKLTSPFLISGYGANKTLALTGDTAGTGELAGAITNPHDRAGKVTTAVTKSGDGTWTLSGTNSYTGPTKVTKGTLSLASASSLGANTDVHISSGATLDLNFSGEMRIGKLYLDGKLQPAGTYSAENAPHYIKGTGVLGS